MTYPTPTAESPYARNDRAYGYSRTISADLTRWRTGSDLTRFPCTDGCNATKRTRQCRHGYPIWLVWWGLVT